MNMLTYILLLLFQGGFDVNWIEIALAVAGALGLREIVPWVLGRRKTEIEIEASKKRIEIDGRAQTDTELDNAMDRWQKAMAEAEKFSSQLFLVRSQMSEKDDRILELKHEKTLWLDEKKQLDDALRGAGDMINARDQEITRLRGKLQDLGIAEE